MKRLFLASIYALFAINLTADVPPYFGVAFEGLHNTNLLNHEHLRAPFQPSYKEFFLQWPQDPTSFNWDPLFTLLEDLSLNKIVPIMTWEPFFYQNNERKNILIEDLKSGKYDLYLIAAAQKIKNWGKPIIIRLMHEMNLKEYHWGTSESNYNALSPNIYQEMYRYIVNKMREQNVTNIFWAFCPNIDSIPNDSWNTLKSYYPGDHYVDILGLDGYNWDQKSFKQLFQTSFNEIKKLNSTKPILIFETASVGSMQEKQQWLINALKISSEWNIKALIWFDIKKENDWRITLNQEIVDLITHLKKIYNVQTQLFNNDFC